MPILAEAHDLAHPVESDGACSGSYYFTCYDPDADTGLFTRIGVRPNEGTIDVGLSVWVPGGGLATLHAIRAQHEMIDTGLEVGGVAYERLAPMKEWRLTAAADALLADNVLADNVLADNVLADNVLAGDVLADNTVPIALDVTFSALMPAI